MSIDNTVSKSDLTEMTNTFFEMTDDLLFFLDNEFNVILVNSAVLRKTGYDLNELKGKKIYDLLSSDFHIIKKKLCSSEVKIESLKLEIIFNNKDKSTFYAESVNTLVSDENGQIKYIISKNRDITERKESEKRVKASDQRIRDIMESVPIGIVLSDHEGNILDANTPMWKILGAESKEEYLQTYAQDFYNKQKDREKFVEQLEKEGEVQEFICQLQRKDGTVFWGSLSSVVEPIETGEKRYVTTLKDITIRKKAEEELQKSKHNLEERIKEITALYAISDLLTNTYLPYDEIFSAILSIIPSAMQFPETTMARITYEGEQFKSPDFEITPWVLSTEIEVEGEKISKLEIYYRDEKPEEDEGPFLKEERDLIKAISQEIASFVIRKKTEDELRLKDLVIETSLTGISITDETGIITYANPASLKMWKFKTKEDLIGKHFGVFLSYQDQEGNSIPRDIMKKEGFWVGEVPARRSDGSSLWVNIKANYILDSAGNNIGNAIFFEDITGRKEAEKKIEYLYDQIKFINQIMRHDIRNNLAITYGSIDLFLESGVGEDKADLLLRAIKGTQKSEDLIERMQELETLLTTGKEEFDIINIREIAEEVVFAYSLPDIDIKIEGNGEVLADVAIKSVLDNIIGNAVKHSEADEIRIKIEEKNGSCVIEISDNGKGVPDEFKDKLFHHRFKHGPAAGTGLGLYIVEKAVEKYGGSVKVEDNEPKGTKFIIKLRKPIENSWTP